MSFFRIFSKTKPMELFDACKEGRVDDVKRLLTQNKIKINKATKDGATPLYIACQNGHVDVVRLLLARKEIDINKEFRGGTPLKIAQKHKFTEIVALLQQHNA